MMLFLIIVIYAQIYTVSEWYGETDPARRAELQWAVCANLGNEWIRRVILVIREWWLRDDFFADFDCEYHGRKLSWKLLQGISERLSIGEALQLGSDLPHDSVLIVHNLDICFTSSLRFLQQDPRLAAFSCFFLSRKEFPSNQDTLIPSQCSNLYQGSHDALVVRLPFPPVDLPFQLGQLGMEATVIWELQQLGYQILNPCHRYPIWHVHRGRTRSWASGEANLEGRSATAPPE